VKDIFFFLRKWSRANKKHTGAGMARTRAGSSNTFEDLFITGLGHLSHDVIGKGLVSFIVMLCVWTFVVHWGLIFGVMWSANAPLAALGTALHQFLHMLLLASLYKAVTTDPGFVARPQVRVCGDS
jgi:TM2 domain-containing membrane protein YozV